jgi:hypothetical protein
MVNLKNWNKKKILFILSDPGSTNIILNLIKKFNLSNYKIFLSNKNGNIKFQGLAKKLINKSTIDKIYKKKLFDLCVIGTGENPAYIRLANKLKKKNFTIAIVDHWLNFTSRFKKNNIIFIPDTIFFTNHYYDLKNYFLKNVKKVLIKDYYEEEKLKEIKKIKKVKYDYLYINDPVNYINSKKIRKKIMEGSFLNFLTHIKSFNKLKILIKFHPNDDLKLFKRIIKNSLKKIENKKIKFYISKENNISKNIGSSRVIIGMQSSALFLAKKSKKQVFISIPNNFFRKYSINNYIKNNIKNISYLNK